LPFSTPYVAFQLAPKIPAGSWVHLGILNSLRAWNLAALDPSIAADCNTGGFGIDGGLSTLIGSSIGSPDRLHFGFVGDLSFFYDMNVLGIRGIQSNVRLLVANNSGGAEFALSRNRGSQFGICVSNNLLGAGHFGTVKAWTEQCGFEYRSASTALEFNELVDWFTCPAPTQRPLILEVFTELGDERRADDLTTYADGLRSLLLRLSKKVPPSMRPAIRRVLRRKRGA
jgi:2-succinyl-5-enolpyruvyl-6-hydroxy-3-cyclohexene-1-carboxylate synthase